MNFEKETTKTIKKQEINQNNDFLEPTKEEKELLTGKVEEIKELNSGINRVSFVKLENGKAGIFKSKKGERLYLRNKVKKGTFFKRERSAYLVDRFLGFNLVPPTVIRKIKGEIGSFQQFVPDTNISVNVISAEILALPSWYKESLLRLWIFDYLIWNSDRHGNNFLVDGKNKLWAIDNGLSFGNDSYYFLHIPYDEIIPKAIRERIIGLNQAEGKKLILRNYLQKLLSNEEIKAFFKRLDKLANFLEKKNKIRNYKIIF